MNTWLLYGIKKQWGLCLCVLLVQVAGKELGISLNKIHVSETNVAVVPNTMPTSASRGSDNFAQAVLVRIFLSSIFISILFQIYFNLFIVTFYLYSAAKRMYDSPL